MEAVTFAEYGPPDVLTLETGPDPIPGPDQVLIAVTAAGVNFAEVMFRRGQIPVGLPHVPGLEAVGRVVAVGDGVDDVLLGTRVAALTLAGGGQADLVVADAALTVPLTGPLAALDDVTAASVICAGTTAVGVLDVARPVTGEHVVVTAAAGAVGRCLLGLLPADVTVTAAVSDVAKLAAPAAAGRPDARIASYADVAGPSGTPVDGSRTGYDVVIDSVGEPFRSQVAARLAAGGRHVIMGDAGQQSGSIHYDDVWFSATSITGYNLGGLAASRPGLVRTHLETALSAAATGRVVLPVRTASATDIAGIVDIHAGFENRTAVGKYVLTRDAE